MGMHKSGRNDTKNPGASCDLTLKDYIERKEKQIRREHQENLTAYERGYQDGYYDAVVDGAKKVE